MTGKRQLFPEKLWQLVNKPNSGVTWAPDGRRIVVERSKLEQFPDTKFRSTNFDSFIRQLHFYGFRKCGNSYHHEKFQQGRPDQLLRMKRKYSNSFHHSNIPNSRTNSQPTPRQNAQSNNSINLPMSSSSSTSSSVLSSTSISTTMHSSSTTQPQPTNKTKNIVLYAFTPKSEQMTPFNEAWPKTLVINRYWDGNDYLLKAYFVF